MPRRTSSSRRMGRRKRGGSWAGFKSFLGKANNFLKRTGLVSKLAGVGASVLPGQYGMALGSAGTFAKKLGYGRRRMVRRRGGALRMAGGALY